MTDASQRPDGGYVPAQGRLLIVDDEQDILDILARALGAAGYVIDTAPNGFAALQALAVHEYDLILSNIRMPVMGGEEFYRQLCRLHARLSRCIVFCTGDIANLATQRFLSSTGAPVIFKPFLLRTVLEVVASKLARERASTGCSTMPMRAQDTAVAPAF